MRESELLAHIYRRAADLPSAHVDVVVGPGDDCAVLRLGSELTLLTVDQLVIGRHAAEDAPIDTIARKAIARSVSDIAAMGGRPRCALATALLPAACTDADTLFDRMHAWAAHWSCPLVGGDIASLGTDQPGPLSLTVTVLGGAHTARGPVLRRGATPGDGLYVTGHIGGAVSSGRHMTFEPRVEEGAWLCDTLGGRLHAMMDLSDGLGIDASHLAEASAARIEIDAGAIPLHPDAGAWHAAAAEGEDYELLFAAAGDVPDRCPATGTPITRIGRVTDGEGCVILDGGRAHEAASLGWEH